MANLDISPVWKKIYPVVSSKSSTVTADIVDEILKLYKDNLVTNLLEYKSYSKESFKTWREQSGLKDFVVDDEMCNFIHLVSKEIDLDVNVSWTVVCNFLMFEYYGKVDELKSIIKYDTNVKYFIDTIWYFYSADRMFLLKTLRYIFENSGNKNSLFHKQFDDFLKSINTNLLWSNLLKVFRNLLLEIDKEKSAVVSNDTMNRWVHRNHREQVEVALLLIHTVQYIKLDGKELEDVVTLFLKHGFTRHPLYQESVLPKSEDILEIKYAEIGCVLSIMEKFFPNPGKCKSLPQQAIKNLEILKADNSAVLFAWAVLRTAIEDSDDAMDYCNLITFELIEKNVFDCLLKLVTHRMFSKSKVGDLVAQAVLTLMCEFVKICADYAFLHEQVSVCYLTAELLNRKGMAVLDYLGPIFQLSMDAFPFVFNPFLEMCKSLISEHENYNKIMKLLKNIPTFLAEIPWNDHRERFHLNQPQRLFSNSDTYTVPAGTLVERFTYQGSEYTKFVYPYSFFTLMEEFTQSLTTSTFSTTTDANLIKLIQIGYKFIIHILSHYQGDFKTDYQLKKLVQRLDIVPSQFCEGPTKNLEFLKLYFEINSTLVIRNLADFSEVFPTIIRKRLFPQVLTCDKISKQLFFNQTHRGSILFRNLKEEESRDDHSLLILYLKLIQDLSEKNLYHQEVQLAGVWYILNVTFPLYQQWHYNDPRQMTTICNICCSIFVQILQKNSSEVSDELFKMCLNAFLHEEVVMSSYLSIFLKDKFYIQNLMEQESNWQNGPLLENIECIRLQLVLLLLLFKHRSTISSLKCTLDDKISIVSKAVSAYMVNPYSVALRILSCRFLEIISRDENIPLMALLGLDYDQIQRLFLDRLRDPTEDEDLKLHILDLISTCIYHQHGMSAAFFNVTRSRKWYSDNKEKTIEGDTVSDFMIDYLQNIKKSHEYLRSPLQVGILNVMANLWMSGKQHLIKDVISLEAFWPLLAEPFSREYNQSPKVYAQILKIFSIQLAESQNENRFLSTIEKFVTNDKQLGLWQLYMLNIFKTENITEESITERTFLLKSWMEFLIMLEKKPDLRKFSPKTKYAFIEMSLKGITYKVVNMYCLKTWMDLCLIQLSNWGLPDLNKNHDVAEKSINMMTIIKLHYTELNGFSRSTILVIIQRILHNLKTYFEANTLDLMKFLEQIGSLIDFEYNALEEQTWSSKTSETTKEILLPWMICINISNALLQFKNINDISLWFCYRNYLPRIIKTTCELLGNVKTVPLAKIAIHSLTLYVESPLVFDFFNINMTQFYSAIEPIITGLLIGHGNKINPLQLEEGWETTTMLLKFNCLFVEKFQHSALPTCYTFMTLHEQILQHIFNIPESTVALRALDLLINTLVFFDTILVNWQLEWYRKSNLTYNSILQGVKKVINSCMYTILRPKNILIYTLDSYYRLNQMEKIPIELMVGIMNKLMTAAGIGFSILYRTNPSLTNLLDLYVTDTMNVLITNDFSVPKFELPVPYDLTYGMLLCLVHFLCKTLDALSLEKKSTTDNLKDYYTKCFALVEHQDISGTLHNQKLSSFLRYAMYEYSGLADPWIQKLDYQCVKKALDLLMIFLGQQIFLAIQAVDNEHSPYFKRNLASELQFFYEYVKKHTSVLLSQQSNAAQYKSEVDVLKRYLLYCKENKRTDSISENNFCIVMSHWLTNICKLK